MGGIWGAARSWGSRQLDELTVDTDVLSRSHRLLVAAGYVTAVGLLVATLLTASITEPSIAFADYSGTIRVSTVLVITAGAAFAAGWALVLTGASDGNRRVFLPLVALAALQLGSLTSAGSGSSLPVFVALAALIVFAFRGPTQIWKQYPLAELGAWLLLFVAAIGLSVSGGNPAVMAAGLYRNAETVALVAFPLWVVLGRDAARASIDLGRNGGSVARRRLAGSAFRNGAAAVTIAWPVLIGVITTPLEGMDKAIDSWLAFSFVMSVPLSLWCITRLADGRWSGWDATLAISLNLSFVAFSLALVSASYETGLVERLVGAFNLLPPAFLFVLLAAYDVVSMGTPQAEREGRHLPRTARVPIYVGALVLIIGSCALLLGARPVEPDPIGVSTQLLPTGGFLIGLAFMGVPHYISSVRRNRDRFIAYPAEPRDRAEAAAALNITTAPPGRALQILWYIFIGWWLSMIAFLIAWMLAVSIVGISLAQRIFARIPAFMALQGSPAPPAGGTPGQPMSSSPTQHPLAVRAIWFVSIGWWLSMLWMAVAWTVALPIVTMPASLRMMRRVNTVLTLQRT